MLSPEDRNLGVPCGSNSKENACNAGDLGPIPGQEDPLEWLPTPVFLPGESPGQRSLADYIQSMGSQ